jgi:hypothetical protein
VTRVPLVIPNSNRVSGDDSELARVERWRDFLTAKISSEECAWTMPPSVRIIVFGLIAGFGLLVLAGVLSGQIASSFVVWTVAVGSLLLFVFNREVRLFGTRFPVGEAVILIMQGILGDPSPWLIGRPDWREQLAECEAEISKLRERRP